MNKTLHGDKNGKCVLDETQICTNCCECDKCDLDPTKICDNCGACLDAYNTNEKGFVGAISLLFCFRALLANTETFPLSLVSMTTLLSYSPIGSAFITIPVNTTYSCIFINSSTFLRIYSLFTCRITFILQIIGYLSCK